MDLPVFRRGLELVSQQLNKLSEGIRAAQITSVIGGTFTRTPGGTTLTINPPPSGGGAGTPAKDCNFNVTDASIWNEAGNQVTTMQVKVANSQLAGVYPTGMDGSTPYYIVLDPETDFSAAGICYLYLRAIVNDDGVISSEENSLTFEPSNQYLPSGQHIQLIPVAQVEIAPITGGSGKEIVKIGNSCPTGVFPLENCPFAAEEASENGTLKVLIANSMIEGVYPNNMERNVPFIHDLTDAAIQYVHADIKLDANGAVDYEDSAAIMIYITDEILPSNAYYQRSVLGMIQVAGGKITAINNYCYSPTVPYTKNCPFEVVDATVEGSPGIVVRNWQVQGRYPKDMTYDSFFYKEITEPRTYVYCKLTHSAAGVIDPSPNGIVIELSPTVQANNSTTTYTLLADVVNEENKPLDIWNYCQMPAVSITGSGNCDFQISGPVTGDDYTMRVGLGIVDNRFPEGMSASHPYVDVQIDGTSYFYVSILFDLETLAVSTEAGAIQVIASSTTKPNESAVQFELIGIVEITDGEVSNIYSRCSKVVPNPCSLAW
jgi:hypothetical protein